MKLGTFEDFREALLSAIRTKQTIFIAEYTGDTEQLAQIYNAIDQYYDPHQIVKLLRKSPHMDVKIQFDILYAPADTQAAITQKRVSELVSTLIDPSMSPHHQVRVLHDWVVLNTVYDQTYTRYSAYDILNDGSAVCQGYALLMDALLNEAGFNTVFVTGTIKPEFRVDSNSDSDGGHAWNMVQIDGHWYHLDATWDDPTPDQAGVVRYDFYLLTDKEIEMTRTIDTDFSNYLRPSAVTSYADYIQQLSLQDPVQQSQISQIIDDTQMKFMQDAYLFGSDDGARFEDYVRNATDEPFVFRAKTKEDVEPLIKRYVQVRERGVRYSFTEYMRTHDTNDVIIEVQDEQN